MTPDTVVTPEDEARARVCPYCKQRTVERTSTNNAFCRACDRTFDREGRIEFTQAELRDFIAAVRREQQQRDAAEIARLTTRVAEVEQAIVSACESRMKEALDADEESTYYACGASNALQKLLAKVGLPVPQEGV